MNAYARPMPYLGFDPAPGDVSLTQDLARRFFQIAAALQKIVTQVEHLDLSAWRGQAADAMRTLQATFPPALRATVQTAQQLEAAASVWAAQLSGFQAEADALERKAATASADLQTLQVKLKSMPTSSKALRYDLQAASAAVSSTDSQAQELHQRYLAAARKTAGGVDEQSGLWGKTEPVRKVLEGSWRRSTSPAPTSG